MITRQAPSDTQALEKLQAVFGYPGFRPLQGDIVRSILDGRDVFVLLPTGGGKSLCYQLPALLLDGLTVVVSPLIALMKDQVDRLQAMGAPATFVNSSLDASEAARRLEAAARGEVKLLYVAPERLMTAGFLRLLGTVKLALFAVDEAHCVSEWGHDFRPEYRELGRLRAMFPGVPLAAFTATATSRVQADIVQHLGLQRAAHFRGSFNRPNLFYDVRPKQGAYQQLTAALRAGGQASAIIYCHSRAGVESLAAKLQADRFSAAAYHAGLDSEERRLRQEAFVRDDLRIIVATIAFGMGIDKPDVRLVVHYDLPKNLEGYYQESGRAGRDSEPSDCLLFYSYGDAAKHQHFIRQKPSPVERQAAGDQLRQMIAWAEGAGCRRRALLAYFDEQFDGQQERCCDNCAGPDRQRVTDCTIPAQMFLSCAKRAGESYGITHLIRVLCGSNDERVLRAGHVMLSTYGIGKDRSRTEWRAIATALLRAGYIRLAPDQFDAVKVTSLGMRALMQREPVLLPLPAAEEAAPRPRPSLGLATAGVASPELFEQLRQLRKRLADERSVPPYHIFPDATLRQMAADLPRDRAALLRVHGVGERKAADFGDAFLDAIASFARPAEERPASRSSAAAERGASARMTLEVFEAGRSPAEIAAERGLAVTTVEGHLAQAMEEGRVLDLDRLVPPEKRPIIEAALAEMGMAPLKPVLERLGEGFSYGEVRFVRAALGWTPGERAE